MRRVTRNAVLLILGVMVALLALGALPSLLASGDPYYVTAEPVAGNGSADGSGAAAINASAAVNGSALSERQYPYTTQALRNGTSDPYREGPWGFKEAFTHSPFDERSALTARNATAVSESGVLVSYNGTLYRVAVGQRP
ncbi:hypothetical protein [Halosimplex pelagicum]|uniref:Uncharacterized protein n=1 Tax=Halosimplex pelagicum TaxID=869886 RepID=A0A7D5T993_9EURY|nr:hypothetical protein [Halosimplex pelagicum]QLH80409.1 hypothetical protein HZS54_01645 [Halosimplex pelagicum]